MQPMPSCSVYTARLSLMSKRSKNILERIQEAKRRDHRVLGKQLDLFTINPTVGQGLVMWLPKGGSIRSRLENFVREQLEKRGYEAVYTPNIGKVDLYQISGHYPYYKDDMFRPITMEDDEQYILKPMNCPHHIMIYKAKPRSYRELPIRLAEFGTVYRYEKSGQLSGMTRVRGFTQDDAHIFCTNEQVAEEFRGCIEMTQFVLRALGLNDYRVRTWLSRPQQRQVRRQSGGLGDGAEEPGRGMQQSGNRSRSGRGRSSVLTDPKRTSS